MVDVPVRLRRRPLITESAVGSPPPPSPPDDRTVTVSIDGREVTARRGQLIIEVADGIGTYIPRFCYHPRLKPVGMCRMCLVEVEGPRGPTLMPACYNPVTDGMKISTTSDMTKKAQDGVLEFLLVNHPLDCPVCDKGGECPLQDQTLAYGPGESRFVEEKRHWDKPIPISELVNLDRERCIQCGRCVRFADEVAGDPLIDFAERGDRTEVAVFAETHPYSSYFSGNIVQICPVGALTATPYRFRARPWDLEQVESTCTACSVGCRVVVQSSTDKLVRTIGIDADPVNWSWLCDKGRFAYQAVESERRLVSPLVRRGDELVEATWSEALGVAAEGLRRALDAGGGESVAIIGGSRLPNEDAYVWAKLARVGLRTDNVDAQLGDGIPAETLLGLPRATIDQAVAAPLLITLGTDPKDELPIVYLRLRHAVREAGLQIVELSPVDTGLTPYTALSVRHRPGELGGLASEIAGAGAASSEEVAQARAHLARALRGAEVGSPSVVVLVGRPSVAVSSDDVVGAVAALAAIPGVAFLSGLRRSNVHGALDLGLAPGVLPGRVGLEEGRAWYEAQWNAPLPTAAGLDTGRILAAAARGRVGALILIGADPERDHPDPRAALKGLVGARFVVAVDTFLTDSARKADVVLPAATWAERRGTFTNLEGRVSHLGAKVTPPGAAWPDWVIAAELGWRLGVDLGVSSVEEIWEEIRRVSPLHAGVDRDALAGTDGVVVPVGAGDRRARPRALDPMADPGIASAELHAVPPTALAVTAPAAERGVVAPPGSPEPVPGASSDMPGTSSEEDLPSPPPMLAAVPSRPVSTPVGEGLRLVTRRCLWDAGTWVGHSPDLAGLAPSWQAALHPEDLVAAGLEVGDLAELSSNRGRIHLPVVADPGVARGCVVVPLNVPGGSGADLVDAELSVVTVRLAPYRGGS
jgi:NADH-quinone oxidoreductase subunit G